MLQRQIEMVDSAIDRLDVHCICKMRCTSGLTSTPVRGFGEACLILVTRPATHLIDAVQV